MNFFKKIFKQNTVAVRKRKRRSYDAGSIGRLLNDWTTVNRTADAEIRGDLKTLRARARELTRNNDHAVKFLEMVKTNVIGPAGITMQSKAKRNDGTLDKLDNAQVEQAWIDWGNKNIASTNKTLSWLDLQNMIIESVARDGEVLIRKVTLDNGYAFALQLLEADYLDEQLNETLPNGNRIRMGIETDQWGAPVNYWLHSKHPGDNYATGNLKDYEVFPASEIIHVFRPTRPGQTRGVPWLASAMTRLHQIGEYDEAAIIAARVGACKMGFFETVGGDEYQGDDVDDMGNTVSEASPGAFEQLPAGVSFNGFDPKYPTGDFGPFMKATLRGVASGLNVSYNSLASDLEGVNFSSLRSGVLEERQNWRCLQEWFIAHVCQPVFESWFLRASLSLKLGTIPATKLDKFKNPKWQPRGWDWVDPKKDAESNKLALAIGSTSVTRILAAQGLDFEDMLNERKNEIEQAKEAGVDITSFLGVTENESNETDDQDE